MTHSFFSFGKQEQFKSSGRGETKRGIIRGKAPPDVVFRMTNRVTKVTIRKVEIQPGSGKRWFEPSS